jgi:hypothetical protein
MKNGMFAVEGIDTWFRIFDSQYFGAGVRAGNGGADAARFVWVNRGGLRGRRQCVVVA